MCGIYACYSHHHVLPTKVVDNIFASMHHRGPDARQHWVNGTQKVMLAHTRLSVQDLRQIPYPISSEDGSIQMIFNGEFYDFKSIRNELIAKGYQFKTETDSEIALFLYQEKGIHCLSQLRGEFAFIIWDENIQTLFAVRDRFGIKPLHYAHHQGQLHLSSEISTLFAAGIPAQWDQLAFYEYLHTQLHPDKTLFEHISQVPAGHYLAYNQYGLRLYKYWDLQYPKVDEHYTRTFEECKELLHQTLLESVKLRLEADVPVAYYLSGGLDSSLLLGMGAHLTPHLKQHAFSICFQETAYSERTQAEATAKFVGAAFHPIDITMHDLAEHFESAAARAMVPMGNAAGIARFILSQQVNQQGFKVILSGEGADEVFMGYNFLRIEAFEDPQFRETFGDSSAELIAKMNKMFPVDREKLKTMPRGFEHLKHALGYVPRWLQTQTYLHATHRNLLSADMLQKFSVYNPYASYLMGLDVSREIDQRSALLKSLYCWIKTFFPNNLLSWVGDRMEMAHSIEGRQPFLDHHLFECARKIPTIYKLTSSTEKYILREVARPYVLPEIAEKEKYMFQAPPLTLSQDNPLFNACIDLVQTYLKDTAMYDMNAINDYLNRIQSADFSDPIKKVDASSTLMSLASLAALQKSYNPSAPD